MKNRFSSIFRIACIPFLFVPSLFSQSYHVFYTRAYDQHVRELSYNARTLSTWLGNDLTAATNSLICWPHQMLVRSVHQKHSAKEIHK